MTRLRRIAVYLNAMFPPALLLPSAVAHFLAIYWTLHALGGAAGLRFPPLAAAGAATVFLLSLQMRVYDELKDAETDIRLGQAGDPRYKDRPLVTGKVTVADLVALRWTVTGLTLAVNLPFASPWPLGALLACMAIQWLSFRWFFYPAMSRNLLLAFVTHNPIALLTGLYVTAVYLADAGRAPADLPPVTVALLAGLWLPLAAWEVARKIRIQEDETEYTTYSKILGPRLAAALAALFVFATFPCFILVSRAGGLPVGFAAFVGIFAILLARACIRFMARPTREGAKLQPLAELYIVVANVGLAIVAGMRLAQAAP